MRSLTGWFGIFSTVQYQMGSASYITATTPLALTRIIFGLAPEKTIMKTWCKKAEIMFSRQKPTAYMGTNSPRETLTFIPQRA